MTIHTRDTKTVRDRESIRALFSATVDHSKAYLSAEKQALTLRAQLTLAAFKMAAVFGLLAAVLGLFALGWLLVTIAAALAVLIGAPLAALVVTLLLLVGASVCAWLAVRALKRIPKGSAS